MIVLDPDLTCQVIKDPDPDSTCQVILDRDPDPDSLKVSDPSKHYLTAEENLKINI